MTYKNCNLCHRRCGVDRTAGERGFCKMSDKIFISRIGLHKWEEPPISGTRGSGTVFFSGCSLGCIYCQNRAISRGECGSEITVDELALRMLALEREGAHNINLVTPTHYAPSVIAATAAARARGLTVPIVYNTGTFDTVETISALSGTVDIYLPDLKYYRAQTAAEYSNAPTLPEASRAAIAQMVAQTGAPVINSEGIMQKGTIVRILLLPGHLAEAKLNVRYLYDTYGDDIYISLMSQYTPPEGMPHPLDRTVTAAEYRELCGYASRIGVTRAFVQDPSSACEDFIPPFDV